MKHILLVFLGGGTGAALRHLVNLTSMKIAGPGFPFGTLTVNIVGSLLMGIFVELLALKFSANTDLRLLIATGFLGGFTTFSAFSLDAAVMIERGAMATAGFYVLLSVFASIVALFVGMTAVRIAFG